MSEVIKSGIEYKNPSTLNDAFNFDILVELLIKKLWIILACIVISVGACHFVMKYFSTPLWRSNAQVELPKVDHLGNYYALLSTYDLLNGQLSEGTELTNITSVVYSAFINKLNSYDVKRQYFQQADFYQQRITGDQNVDNQLLEEFINSITFTPKSSRNPNDSIYLSSNNPRQAKLQLDNFIGYVNTLVRDEYYNTLIFQWRLLFQQNEQALKTKLTQNRQGERVESAFWQSRKEMMTSVQALDNQFKAFNYLQMPSQPLQSYFPNSKLWLTFSGMLGMFLGICIVLFLRSKRLSK